eukprot:scaffold363_cov56-Cylindrotheca_fusiformis.AAC.2
MYATPQPLDRRLRRQSRNEELPSPPRKKARFIILSDGAVDANLHLPKLPEGPQRDSDPRPVALKIRPNRLTPVFLSNMKKASTSASFLTTEPMSLMSLFLAVSNNSKEPRHT